MIAAFYYSCDFLYTAVETWVVLQFIEAVSTPKRGRITELILKGITLAGAAGLTTYNNTLDSILFSNNMFLTVVFLVVVMSCFIYKCQIYSSIIVTFYFFYGFTLIDFFVQTILYFLLFDMNMAPALFITAGIHRGVYLILYSAFIIWFGAKLKQWISLNKIFFIKKNNWLYILILPLMACMVYFQQIYILQISEHYMSHWWIFILGLLLVLLMGGMYIAKQREETRFRLQQQKSELLESNYQSLLKAYEEKSILLHDFRNQMQIIQEFAETNQNQELLAYITSTQKKYQSHMNRNFANHNLLNLILNTKKEEAEKAGIAIQYELDDMAELKLSPVDICSLFLNLLDNAIEANPQTGDAKKRWLKLSCKRKEQTLVIVASNSMVKPMADIGEGIPKTTKADKAFHGFGMRSIQQVVDSYNGYMKIHVQQETFTLSIFLLGF